MKKIRNIFKIVVLGIMLICIFNYNISIADVGSFESYDSGGWDSGSSWSSWDSSSSYDHDYSYGYGSGGNFIFFGGGWGAIIYLIIIIVIAYISYKNRGNVQRTYRNPNVDYNLKSEDVIESEVKAIDELFNKEEFISYAKDVFVKLQEAWTARDWNAVRVFETNELFDQHYKQLQGYINNKQINMLERICVKSARLADFKQSGDKDILSVHLSSKMIDYIINEETGKVIKGNRTTDRHSTYRLTFVRKTGVKTKAGTNVITTTNCPNCGAPTHITSAGECEYCGSVVVTGEYNWVLSNLEKIG